MYLTQGLIIFIENMQFFKTSSFHKLLRIGSIWRYDGIVVIFIKDSKIDRIFPINLQLKFFSPYKLSFINVLLGLRNKFIFVTGDTDERLLKL